MDELEQVIYDYIRANRCTYGPPAPTICRKCKEEAEELAVEVRKVINGGD